MHPLELLSKTDVISSEEIAHAKPMTGGRDQPTRYVEATAMVELHQVKARPFRGEREQVTWIGVDEELYEVRVVHPSDTEPCEVFRFASKGDAEKQLEALKRALGSSLAAQAAREEEESKAQAKAALDVLSKVKPGTLEAILASRGLDPKAMKVEDHTKG